MQQCLTGHRKNRYLDVLIEYKAFGFGIDKVMHPVSDYTDTWLVVSQGKLFLSKCMGKTGKKTFYWRQISRFPNQIVCLCYQWALWLAVFRNLLLISNLTITETLVSVMIYFSDWKEIKVWVSDLDTLTLPLDNSLTIATACLHIPDHDPRTCQNC